MGIAKHIILIIALFIIIVIAFLSFDEIKGNKGAIDNSIQVKTSAAALLNDIVYIKTVKDFEEFNIRAKSGEYFKDENTSIFKDINADFYSKKGSEYNLIGDKGTYNTKDDEILVDGGVVLTSTDGYELRTDSLFYSYKTKTILTDDPVALKKGDLSLEGIGMKLDLDAERLNIIKKVKGHVKGS